MNRVWRIPATALLAVLAAGTAHAQRNAGSRSIAIPAGAPPSRVTVTGTPALTRVSWASVGATYLVERRTQGKSEVEASSGPLRFPEWHDPLPASGTYVYRITATYADGSQGSVDVSYVRPEPTNPAVLTAIVSGFPTAGCAWQCWVGYPVRLTWTEVPGAAYYLVWGPSIVPTAGFTGFQTTVPGHTVHPVGTGVTKTWTVAAFFLPGPIGTAPANYTTGSLLIPTPGPPKP